MRSRRAVITGGAAMAGVAGLGGMPPRPLNAPAGQQAAGGVQPGQSNAIVTANRVIITGASGGLLVYAGAPAAFGNLIASISAVAGTDQYGNAFLPGEVSYFHGASLIAVQSFAGTTTWYTAASAAGPWSGVARIAANLAGTIMTIVAPSLQVQVAGDLNLYNAASLTIPMNPVGQLVNSVAAATVNNLTANVAAGVTYRLRAQVQYAGAAAAGTANFQFGTTAAFSTQWGDADFHDGVTGTSGYVARPAGLGPFASPVLSVNNWFAKFDALATCTAAGLVSLQAFCSVAADTFTIKNAFMEIIPLA